MEQKEKREDEMKTLSGQFVAPRSEMINGHHVSSDLASRASAEEIQAS